MFWNRIINMKKLYRLNIGLAGVHGAASGISWFSCTAFAKRIGPKELAAWFHRGGGGCVCQAGLPHHGGWPGITMANRGFWTTRGLLAFTVSWARGEGVQESTCSWRYWCLVLIIQPLHVSSFFPSCSWMQLIFALSLVLLDFIVEEKAEEPMVTPPETVPEQRLMVIWHFWWCIFLLCFCVLLNFYKDYKETGASSPIIQGCQGSSETYSSLQWCIARNSSFPTVRGCAGCWWFGCGECWGIEGRICMFFFWGGIIMFFPDLVCWVCAGWWS